MTVIAWDGITLAADKMTNFGGLYGTTTKVHHIGDKLVGGCGTTALIQEMINWIKNGCDPEKFPEPQRDPNECAAVLVVNRDGTIHQYESTPWPIVLQNKQWAIGSGRDFAMAAMYLGKTAAEAVEITSALCNDCGAGVDVVSFGSQHVEQVKPTRCVECKFYRGGSSNCFYGPYTRQIIEVDHAIRVPYWCTLWLPEK